MGEKGPEVLPIPRREVAGQIFAANIVLLFVLITIHEIGHWAMGCVAGLPANHMKIRLLTFPQQVVLREGDDWVSISDYDRYNAILHRHVPSPRGRFLYIVGGFLFETVFLALLATGHWFYATIAVGVSLLMFLIYLFAMDIPQARSTNCPWGDTTVLYAISRTGGVAVAIAMVLVRLALIAAVPIAAVLLRIG